MAIPWPTRVFLRGLSKLFATLGSPLPQDELPLVGSTRVPKRCRTRVIPG